MGSLIESCGIHFAYSSISMRHGDYQFVMNKENGLESKLQQINNFFYTNVHFS